MAEYLEAVKRYMRVDGDEDDGVIAALYEAAVLYLKNAGVRETEASLPLYNLCVWSLTLHYYDHRDAVGSEAEIPVGLRPVLNQLKLTAAIQGDID
nr:head-tail connector protein [uncultured Oscillibacter sp.]